MLIILVSLIQNGSVPLEIAAASGHTHTVQRLLEAEAIVNYQRNVSHWEYTL